jgi:iron complex outermembrane receptor protein
MKHSTFLSFLLLTNNLYGVELAPINVSADKIDESVVDNAQTIDTINADKIKLTNTTNIKELSSIVSNTNISGIGNRNDTTITMRGISNYVTYESSVAMYVDDVPLPFSYAFGLLDMNNVESIEVLKGGQGTLFGKSSESGLINIYTKAPSNHFEGEISAGYGSYNSKSFYARVSGNTGIKNLNYGFSVTQNSSDGYTHNVMTGNNFDYKDFTSFSAKLNYKPSDTLDITLSYVKSDSDDGGAPFTTNSTDNPFNIDGEAIDDSLKIQSDALSLRVKYQEDKTSFSSTTSLSKYSQQKSDYIGILGGIDLDTDIDIQEFVQEFKYKREFENSDLTIGAFYSDKTTFDYQENITLLTLYPMPISSLNTLEVPDKNIALFTQYRYYFNENYSLMAGLRYQESERLFDRAFNDFGAKTVFANDTTTDSEILPTLSFSYYADDGSHSYFTYSKGYRSGGYSYRAAKLLDPFEADSTDSFELGYKKVWKEGLSFNSVLFYNALNNHRINIFTDTLGSIVLNADKAYSYGLELDIKYQKDNLLLYSSLGWTEAKYQEFAQEAYRPYENNSIIEVPNITASLGLRYDINANLYVNSSLRYMSERYYNIENTAKADAYMSMNASIGYRYEDWLVEAYATNIFDTEYVDFMIATPSNEYSHFGVPRVLGMKVSKKF